MGPPSNKFQQRQSSNIGSEYATKLDQKSNDDQLNRLHTQVSTLKNITIEIGHEVREQNRLLDNMGLEFGQAGSLLSQTMNQLRNLTASEKSRSYIFYASMLFAMVFILFFLRSLF